MRSLADIALGGTVLARRVRFGVRAVLESPALDRATRSTVRGTETFPPLSDA